MALKVWIPLLDDVNNQGTELVIPTNTGATKTTSIFGPLGSSYYFNGSSNQVIASYQCAEAEYTVCIWAYFSKWNVHLLDMRNQDGSGYQPMYVAQTQIQVGGGDGSFIYIPCGTLATDTWYHICVAGNSSGTSLYINGELKGTANTKAVNLNKKVDIHIGSRYSGSNWFGGNACDFRLYNERLSDYDIRQIAKGLLLHYKYRPNGFSYIPDSSGFRRDGTIYGTVPGSVRAPARYNLGMNVGSSVDNYISAVSPNSNTRTVSFWITAPKTASTVAFADYKSKFAFGFNASLYIIPCCQTSFKMFASSKFIASSPNFVVLRYNSDKSDMELFINGEQETTRYSTNYWTHSTDTLMIGKRSTGSPMSCSISDFRMYGTSLSDADILDLYHTQLKVQSDNSIHTFELVEDTLLDKVSVRKNGTLVSNDFDESGNHNSFQSVSTLAGNKPKVVSKRFVER